MKNKSFLDTYFVYKYIVPSFNSYFDVIKNAGHCHMIKLVNINSDNNSLYCLFSVVAKHFNMKCVLAMGIQRKKQANNQHEKTTQNYIQKSRPYFRSFGV